MAVTAHAVDLVKMAGDLVTLRIDASAGFYVRALAHELGQRLGCGAHLAALRRTRAGDATLDQALPLDAIEKDPVRAAQAIVPMSAMLPGLPAVTLTSDGVRHALHGQDLGPNDTENEVESPSPFFVRLVNPAGELIGIAAPASRPGLLHPAVVLM